MCVFLLVLVYTVIVVVIIVVIVITNSHYGMLILRYKKSLVFI